MRKFLLYILLCFGLNVSAQTDSLMAGADQYDLFFHEGERQMLQKNYAEAYELFSHCLELNPNSGVALYELATLNRYMRNDSLSIVLMEKATRLYPDNYWYKDMLVKLYFNNNRKADAQTVLEAMAAQYPDKEDVLMMLLDVYASNNDNEKMVKTLDKLEVKEGKSEQLSMEKFRLFVQMKDEKSAFREMNSLAQEYPNDLRYQVLIGDLYFDQGKNDEAMKVYDSVLRKDSTNINVLLSLANFYNKTGQDSLYQLQLGKIVGSPSIDSDNRFQFMNSLVYDNLTNHKDSVSMLNLFDKALNVPQEDARLLELYARYLSTIKMPDDTIRPVLQKILDMEPENDMARNHLLMFAIDENNTDDVMRLCKTAVDYNTVNPVYYYYLATSYFLRKDYKETEEVTRKGLEHATSSETSNLSIITGLYELLGDVCYQQGKVAECFEAYDSCLIYRYDNASVLNNYAYYLSLQKKDLQRAEDMSKRSLELSPDNPTYLDTYAWILYQQKRYDEAKEYMDKVVELTPPEEMDEDGDIVLHVRKINAKAKKK